MKVGSVKGSYPTKFPIAGPIMVSKEVEDQEGS